MQYSSGWGSGRAGQFSTYVKPFMLIIFVVLFLFLLTSVFSFRGDVQQQEQQTSFRQEAQRNLQALTNCLRVSDTANTNSQELNLSQLEEFDRLHKHREPPCAEDFQYGYRARIKERFVTGNQDVAPRVDLVFIIDMSKSITEDDLPKLCNQKKNIVRTLRDRGYAVDFKVYGLNKNVNCIEEVLSADPNEDQPVDHKKGEDWAPGITWAARNHPWRPNTQKFIFPMTDECPNDGGPFEKVAYDGGAWTPVYAPCDGEDQAATDEAIQAANEQNVTVFPIMAQAGDHRDVNRNWYGWSGHDPIPYAEQIAQATEGEVFFMEKTADLTEKLVEIVVENTYIYHNKESTCVLPTKEHFGRKLDAALLVDASSGMGEEWQNVCKSVDDIQEEIERRGWVMDADEIPVYAPGGPSPDTGQGSPVTLEAADTDDTTSEDTYTYDHTSGNLPSCLSEDNVVGWNGPPSFDSSTDYGLSAWGIAAKSILQNRNWDEDAQRRSLIVLGNDDPTGGTLRSDESSVTDRVISAANNQNVQVSLLSDANENIDNEVQSLMDRVASETGGNSLKYSTVTDLTDQVADGVSNQENKVCTSQEYVFGETEGSEGRSLKDGIEMSFPVTIKRSATYSTPATLFIRLRDGPMEKILGAANRLVKEGQEQGEQVSGALWVTVEQKIYGEMHEFERPVKTRYRLTTGGGGSTVSVDEDFVVGVNGVRKFTDLNNAQSDIDFSQQENQFTGYKGATFQVIAINQKHPDMSIDSLQVECVDQTCDGPQTILDSSISASEGSQAYRDRGELGVFYHNFTKLKIGGMESPEEAAICTQTPEDDNCGILRADNIEEFSLSPGRQLVQISYDPNTDTVIVGE